MNSQETSSQTSSSSLTSIQDSTDSMTTIATDSASNSPKSKQQQQRHSQIESISDLRIVKAIGAGKTCQVFMAKDYQNTSYAVKKLRPESYSCSAGNNDGINEVKILCDLQPHVNLPRVHYFDGAHIVLDLHSNGELFDFISSGTSLFNEDLSRFYFTQLVDVVTHLHTAGIAHRDIKPENILISDEFDLKLCDFGCATQFTSNHKEQQIELLEDIVGTDGYMAPELLRGRKYNGFSVDIFALGVVLFCMVSGFPPYLKKASPSDPYYRFFVEKRLQSYWRSLQRKYNRTYSKEFIDLVSAMLAFNPADRPSIQEIHAHPWMQKKGGDSDLSKEQVVSQMTRIKQLIQLPA